MSTKPRCSCSATSAAAPCCRAATPTSCPPRARCGAAWGGRRHSSCRSAGPAPPLPTRCRLPLTPRPTPNPAHLCLPLLWRPNTLCVPPPKHSRIPAHRSRRLARPTPRKVMSAIFGEGSQSARAPGAARAHWSGRPGAAQEAAATVIQKSFRRHLLEVDLRRRAFSRFGDEALDLIRRCAPAPAARPAWAPAACVPPPRAPAAFADARSRLPPRPAWAAWRACGEQVRLLHGAL